LRVRDCKESSATTPGGRTPAFHLSQVAAQVMVTYSNCADLRERLGALKLN
jgi:hypothetical protein